jgi:hypothetical protein
VGWRGTCLAYAAVALVVILPLYAFGFPREAPHRPGNADAGPRPVPATGNPRGRRFAIVTFAAIMTLASVITTVVSVHLLTLLQARGLGLAEAVGLGALFGPAQVGARALEVAFGKRHHPIWTLAISTIGVTAGLAMLMGAPAMIAAGILLYGAGSGVRAIARGTVPLALFGPEGYAALIGKLALPVLVAQAASPAIGAVLMRHLGTTGTMGALRGGGGGQHRTDPDPAGRPPESVNHPPIVVRRYWNSTPTPHSNTPIMTRLTAVMPRRLRRSSSSSLSGGWRTVAAYLSATAIPTAVTTTPSATIAIDT